MLFLIRPRDKIYLMLSASYPLRVKIGVSNRPQLRATQVGQRGKKKPAREAKVLFAVGMPFAYKVEAAFHALYAPLNAPTKGDGRTEWFTCLPLVLLACVVALFASPGATFEGLLLNLAAASLAAWLAFVGFTMLALLVCRAIFEMWPLVLVAAYICF